MVKLLREMNERERELYELEEERHPWMKTVKMTDDEFQELFDRDLGEGATLLHTLCSFRDHWKWVWLCYMKHFYETGEYHFFDHGYFDGQNDWDLIRIMRAHGADKDTINGVLCKEFPFKF